MKKASRIFVVTLILMLFAAALLGGCTPYVPTTGSVYRTVSFDSDGGGEFESVRVQVGKTAQKPATDPKKEGYTFLYWTNEGVKYDFSTPISESIELVASYSPISYQITYELGGGELTADAPTSYTIESESFTLPVPTREGAVFLGWTSAESDAPTLTVSIPTGSLGDKAYTANWLEDGCIVYFDTGFADVCEPAVTPKDALLEAPVISREGYRLLGWYLGESAWDFDTMTVTENFTLVARWEAERYAITYDLGGGTMADAPSYYTVESESFTLPVPTKDGATFLGWTFDGQSTPVLQAQIPTGTLGDKTFVAHYSPNSYTVNFVTDGSPVESVTVSHGEKLTMPVSEKAGFVLVGWYLGEQKWDFENDTVTESITLTAVWQRGACTVTFDAAGGTAVESVTQDYGTYITEPSTEKTGYTFLGWYLGDEKWDFAADTLTENITLTAKWQINTYTVTFVTDGTAVAPVTQAHGTLLTSPTTEKTGYTLLGWMHNGALWEFESDVLTEDMTLEALWQINSYTVTFDAAGGTAVESVTQDYGTYITEPSTEKTGYTFLGWYLGDEKWDFAADTLTENITLVAKWQINTYTVTFVTDGTAVAPVTQAHGTLLTSPTTEKTGYTLLGWMHNGALWEFESDVLTEDMTLEALWQINSYTVTFDAAGGTEVAPVTQDYGTYIAPPSTEKTGYTFLGWYLGEKMWDFATDTLTEDVTLTAKWQVNAYTVTFDAAGGTATDPITQDYATLLTAPATERAGYTLDGWYLGDEKWDFESDVLTEDMTLVAKWTPVKYTISYELSGGSLTGINKITSYTVETATFTLGTPTRSHYTFLGWTYEGQSTPALTVTVAQGTTGDLTFVANWQINSYTLTFDAAGGTAVDPITQEYNTLVTAPTTERVGYTFLYWTENGTDAYSFESGLAKNATLTAVWELNTYTVTFDAAGGTAVDAVVQEHGTVLSAPTTERAGYELAGWYLDGVAWDFENDTLTESMTLVAKWTPVTYTISYELDGGTLTDAPDSYDITSDTLLIPAPERDGYTFLGWIFEGQQTPVLSMSIPTGSVGDLFLTATWGINVHTVTLDTNGAAALESVRVEHGNLIGAPAVTRQGYTLLGWYLDGALWNFESDTVTEDITLVALWQINSYTVTFDAAGGTAVEPITQDYGTYIAEPSTKKTGYAFLGWYLGDEKWDFAADTLTEDVTLTAKWQINTYTVTLDAADGTEASTVSVDYGSRLSSPELSRAGYTLLGWYLDGVLWNFESDTVTEDITLVADWEIISYTISYELSGGSLSAANKVTSYNVESESFTLGTPTKSHYTFLGWTFEGQSTPVLTVTVAQGTTGDLTFVANWQINSYTLTFDAAGGTEVDPITQEYNTLVTAPTTERVGYTFLYWTKNGYSAYNFDNRLAANATLTAVWQINSYTVTYDAAGGTAVDAVTQEYGTYLTAPTTERTGYTLDGWYCGEELWDFESDVLTEDMTLVAKWTPVKYTISYELSGGSLTGINKITSYTVETATFTLGTPTRSHYTFLGWTGEGQDTPTLTLTIACGTTGDLTFVANWQINSYTLTFDAAGGTAVDPITQEYNTLVTAPTTEREGYTFLYWTKNGYSAYNFDNRLTADATLTAVWQINSYTVTYDAAGGTAVDAVTQEYGTYLTAPTTEKTGYTLLGWYLDGEAWDFESDTLAKDMTLVAKWQVNSYTVTFDAAGGTAVDAVTQELGTYLAAPTTEKTGYTFLGWYLDGVAWDFESDTLTEDMTLVAKWSPVTYTITYELDGGTLTDAPTSFTVESDTFTLPIPSKDNYTFLGWTYEGQTTPVQNVTIQEGSIGDRVYTASFRVNAYTVTFYTNGAAAISSITLDYGSLITEPTVSKDGYELVGWYLGDKLWDFESDTVAGNMTLSAVWNVESHKISFEMGDTTYTVYVNHGNAPEPPESVASYNGMRFVCWDREIANATEDTTYVAIYTDTISKSDMINMYGMTLLKYSQTPGRSSDSSNSSFSRASALYLMALQEHENPMDGPLRERVLEHLRNIVTEGNAPGFDLGPIWNYTPLTAAIALARNTPTIWKHVDSELEEKLDVMMRTFAYLESFGTSDYNSYVTGPTMYGNYSKTWNPNYRMANIPVMIYVTAYFGVGDMTAGADVVNGYLKSFDEDAYDALIASFTEYGWGLAVTYWTTEGGNTVTGNESIVGLSAKELLVSGGQAVCKATSTASTSLINGGTGLGVGNGGNDYLYGGAALSEPEKIIESLISHNYGKTVISEFWYDMKVENEDGTVSSGDGVLDLAAYIIDGSTSPYEGQEGMMTELCTGNRSSTGYCSHDFQLTTIILSSAKALGIYDIEEENPTLYQKVIVGNEDFFYKNEIGYMGYAEGSYGVSQSVHSEANEGVAYFAFKTYWREIMYDDGSATFPILPY